MHAHPVQSNWNIVYSQHGSLMNLSVTLIVCNYLRVIHTYIRAVTIDIFELISIVKS